MRGVISPSPASGPLGRLTAAALDRSLALVSQADDLRAAAADAPVRPSLVASLRALGDVAVIAEIKRASPSKGEMNAEMSASEAAAAYAAGGARGVSVLTEPTEFGGSLLDLAASSAACTIPLIRKDFIVRPEQLWEARIHGASAVLLIARALDPAQLHRLAAEARRVSLEALVEVRTDEQMRLAIECGAPLIGVNARNLETLEIDASVVLELLPRVPADRIAVAESGITNRAAVEAVAEAGADAVLVGSALTQSTDAAALLRSLQGINRRTRNA